MQRRNKPEVLAPAGNLRGLKTAVDYGADAVYCGGKAFGMRSAPKNLSLEDFEEGARYAHERGARVYVTFNVLPRNNEVEAMREYLGKLKDTGVDALIVSDIGVMLMAKQVAPNLELHVSTQAGVTNYQAANAFYELGARRVVLAREMDLQAVRDIRARIPDDLDIECFVHGAMCMAFSGRCLFSNYLTGRDGNHGECAQPCRWKYSIVEEKRPGQYFPIEQTAEGAYLFNSQDMNMLAHIDDLLDSGATSLKIEGRSKSAYYIAAMTNAYKTAVNEYMVQRGFEDADGNVLKPFRDRVIRPGDPEYGKPDTEDAIMSNADGAFAGKPDIDAIPVGGRAVRQRFGWQRFVRQYRDWRAGQSELPRTQHPTQVEHRRRNTAGRLASRRCTAGTTRHPAGLAARRARQSGAPRLLHRLLLSGTQSAAKHRPFRILPRMARRRRSAVMESGRRRTRDHHEPQQDRSRPGSRIRAARRGPLRLHRACRRFP